MRQLQLDNVQEAGSYNRLPAGGYICRYTKVEDVPEKEYLYMEFDIESGEYKDYYKKTWRRVWTFGVVEFTEAIKKRRFLCSKGCVLQLLKAIPGLCLMEEDRMLMKKTLVGKHVGLILGEEEYIGNDGNKKTRLYVNTECDVNDIKAGRFRVPELKKKTKRRLTAQASTKYRFYFYFSSGKGRNSI